MSGDGRRAPSLKPALNIETNALILRLRRVTSLSNASLDQIAAVCGPPQTFAAHADIVREGGGTDSIHLVVEGWCCRYRLLADGRRQFPAILLPGDICDLDGLMLRRIHFGVAALTACKVARIPREQLIALMDANVEVRDAFWWLLSVENSIASEWAVGLGRRSTEERLAHLLCELLVRLTTVQADQGNTFELPLIQQELGDALGVSTVHVNRTLQGLRTRGILRHEGRTLTVLDLDALQELAGFNPDYLHLEGLRPPDRNASH